MKLKLLSLLSKLRSYILGHKIASIIAVSAIAIAAAVTTGAVLLTEKPAPSEAYVKKTTGESTSLETTGETLAETSAEAVSETSIEETTKKYNVIPKENLNIGKDTSVQPEQKAPVSDTVIDYNLYEVAGIQYGIDVSKWQNKVGNTYKDIDWAAIKAAGINYVMIKCGGRSIDKDNPYLYEDVCFRRNIEGALSNGLQVGIYFFSQALTEQEAIEEASFTASLIKGYKITYPVAFDWEGYNSPDYRVYRGYNSFTPEQLTNISIAFCETVKGAGYTPMHYGNPDSFKNWRFNIDTLSAKYKIWLAQYPASAESRPPHALKSTYNYTYQMWQYGSTNTLPGIPSGIVDVNIAYFGYSGTQASTAPIKLNISTPSFVTNVGTPVNLLSGVTASNTVGSDVSSEVSLTVKNSSGTTMEQNQAFNTPGSYVLTYKIVDFTGGSKSANATLTVRGRPVISGIQPSYYAYTDTSYDEIVSMLKTGITALNYEGQSLTGSIIITGFSQDGLISGNYSVTYHVTDSNGLSSEPYSTNLIISEREQGRQ